MQRTVPPHGVRGKKVSIHLKPGLLLQEPFTPVTTTSEAWPGLGKLCARITNLAGLQMTW